MWYGEMPNTPSQCMGPRTHLNYQSTYQLIKGKFIVRHVRSYYGTMLP